MNSPDLSQMTTACTAVPHNYFNLGAGWMYIEVTASRRA